MHEHKAGSEIPLKNKSSLADRLRHFFYPSTQSSKTGSENPVTANGDIQTDDDKTTSSETAEDVPSSIDQTPSDYITPELTPEEFERMNSLFNRLFEQAEEFLQRKHQSGHQPIDQIAPLVKKYSSDLGDLMLTVNIDREKTQVSSVIVELSNLVDNPDFKRSNTGILPKRFKPSEKLKDTCQIIITKKSDGDFTSDIKRSISEDFPFDPYVPRRRQSSSWSRNFSSREIVVLEEVVNQANKELQETFELIDKELIEFFLYLLYQLHLTTDTPGIRRLLVECGLNAGQIDLFIKQLNALKGMTANYLQKNKSTQNSSLSN